MSFFKKTLIILLFALTKGTIFFLLFDIRYTTWTQPPHLLNQQKHLQNTSPTSQREEDGGLPDHG